MKTCITIHGVRSHGRWQKNFDKYIQDSERIDIKHIPYSYGFVPAFYCIIPFIRRYHTKKFQRWLFKKIYPLYGDNITVVCHSFGSHIAFHALKNSLGCKKLIIFGGILHCRERFQGIIPNKIKTCNNFHSKTDEICMLNPLGHCGAWGFRNKNTKSKIWKKHPYKNKKITNHKCLITEHTQWFPSRFPDILKLL